MKKVVCWGGVSGHDSFRHILGAFHSTARKLGIEAHWVPDALHSREVLTPGSVCITVDVFSQHIGPALPGVDYVIHNYNWDDHELCRTVEAENTLRLQVYTVDATGEPWDECRLFNRQQRCLYQPWGSALLTEEFEAPVFNAQSREAVFIGAVWSDFHEGVDMGNRAQIDELAGACAENGLEFKTYTQVSDADLMRLSRAARLAPTVVGAWQCAKAYQPCRAFKHASFGIPVLTNSGPVSALFGGDPETTSVTELVEGALRIKAHDYMEMARADQLVASRYTYREALAAIERALEEGR